MYFFWDFTALILPEIPICSVASHFLGGLEIPSVLFPKNCTVLCQGTVGHLKMMSLHIPTVCCWKKSSDLLGNTPFPWLGRSPGEGSSPDVPPSFGSRKKRRRTESTEDQRLPAKCEIICKFSLERILGFHHKWVHEPFSTYLNHFPTGRPFGLENTIARSASLVWCLQSRRPDARKARVADSCGLVLFWWFDAMLCILILGILMKPGRTVEAHR